MVTERERERRTGGYDRGAGGGGCSFKPIAMVRPGVWQTLRSVSNNVNKRASILRFYRPALSIFDNAPARARDSRRNSPVGVRGGWRAYVRIKNESVRRGMSLGKGGSFGKNRGRVTFAGASRSRRRFGLRGKRIAKK